LGDSHAALYGHGIRGPGKVKATYGTGSSLMTLTDLPVRSRAGLSTTIAWQRGDAPTYALEGNISVSAQAAAWMADVLGLGGVDALTALASTVTDAGGIVFVPALVGLGAPYWHDRARAVLSGMSLATKPAHIARATLEAIALQVADVFDAMNADVGGSLSALSVDGAATRNDLLMQIQSDLLSVPVQRSRIADLSAVGVGALAAIAFGLWSETDAERFLGQDAGVFPPRTDSVARSTKLREWHDAVNLAIGMRTLR
jgi:glycerol kinase